MQGYPRVVAPRSIRMSQVGLVSHLRIVLRGCNTANSSGPWGCVLKRSAPWGRFAKPCLASVFSSRPSTSPFLSALLGWEERAVKGEAGKGEEVQCAGSLRGAAHVQGVWGLQPLKNMRGSSRAAAPHTSKLKSSNKHNYR